MSILKITPLDFKSQLIFIATNKHTSSGLQEYIDEVEVDILQDLLGCELYDLFAADIDPLTGKPVTQIYLDIYNSFCLDESECYNQVKSEGMVKMIQKFIFFFYTRDQKVKNTTTGNIVNENEVSRETDFSSSRIYQVYNKGIKSYKAIQYYICDNESDYPKFNGERKQKTSWL